MRLLGIVPARGGSKGVHRKNLADLCGLPLIGWSVKTGLDLVETGIIDRCIVSTDDAEIAMVASRLGADVPFVRPPHLATDEAKAVDYVSHALDLLQDSGETYDAVVLLQPTSPIRDVEAIGRALSGFENSDADSLISCYREDYVNDLVMYRSNGDGTLTPKAPQHAAGIRRQDHGPIWVRNGSLYATRTRYLQECDRLVCDRPMLMEMSKSDSVDVDTPDDLILLRKILCG